MKYKEFTDKKNAIEFAKENGGYYEIVVDDRANNIYIVFLQMTRKEFWIMAANNRLSYKDRDSLNPLLIFLIWYIIYISKKKGDSI